MSYYLGIDLGTSALKLLLVDDMGNIVNEVSRTYNVYFPQPGWSEQKPEDWWNEFVSGVKELIKNIDPNEIAGIGVGGQCTDLLH